MCGTMEDSLGMTVASFCFALIPYYSMILENTLSLGSAKCGQKLISALVFIIILLTAAEANSKVSTGVLGFQGQDGRVALVTMFLFVDEESGCSHRS